MTIEAQNLLKRARADYMTAEPVSIARPFLQIAPFFFGKNKIETFLSLYQYARKIDDTVDSGINPSGAKQLLRSDLGALSHIAQGAPLETLLATSQTGDMLYRRGLLHTGLSKVSAERQVEFAQYLHQALVGAYWDNTAIMHGRPIHDHIKSKRDESAVLAYFEILSRIFLNKPFVEAQYKDKIELFFQWVLRFDGLDDIITDLEHGIWTFTRKSLKDSNVELIRGKIIGPEIESFYNAQRNMLVQDSKTILPHIYLCNLPLIAKAALHARLAQQTHRISKTEWPKGKSVVFGKAR